MAIASLLIKIGADISSLETKLDRTERAVNKTAKSVEASSLSFNKLVASHVTASAAIGLTTTAISTLSDFLQTSVASYAAAEAAQSKLTTALAAQGTLTPELTARYGALAAKIQQTTVVSDDLATEMASLLVQVGNVMPSQMEAALQAATDLSAGLGVDLRAATLLVGKAFAGETETLKKYGIVIDETKLKTEGVKAVLDGIAESFGGQGAAAIETYTGKVQQLANAWDDVKEAVGKSIVQDPILAAGLSLLTEQARGAASGATTAGASFLEMWSNLATGSEANAAAIRGLGELADAYINTAGAAQRMRDAIPTPGMFKPQSMPFPAGYNEQLTATIALWKEETAAEKAAEAAAKSHAKSLQDLHSRLSGTGAIKAAEDYVTVLKTLPPISSLTRTAQDELNGAFERGFHALVAQGQGASALARELLGLMAVTAQLSELPGTSVPLSDITAIPAALPSLTSDTSLAAFDAETQRLNAEIQGVFETTATKATETASTIRGQFTTAFADIGNAANTAKDRITSTMDAIAESVFNRQSGISFSEGFGTASRMNSDTLRGAGLTIPTGVMPASRTPTMGGMGFGMSVTVNAPGAYGLDTPEGRRHLGAVVGPVVMDAFKRAGGRG